MGHIALFLKTAQHGADRRVLQRAIEFFADMLGGDLAKPPDDGKDAAFEFAEFGRIVARGSITRHSVTDCNIGKG